MYLKVALLETLWVLRWASQRASQSGSQKASQSGCSMVNSLGLEMAPASVLELELEMAL